jgi:hypothetical protein
VIREQHNPHDRARFAVDSRELCPPRPLTVTAVLMVLALGLVGRRVGTGDPSWLLLLSLAALPCIGLIAVWDRSWRIAGRPGRHSSTLLRLGLVLLLIAAPVAAQALSPATAPVAPFIAVAAFLAAFDLSLRRDVERVTASARRRVSRRLWLLPGALAWGAVLSIVIGADLQRGGPGVASSVATVTYAVLTLAVVRARR